MERRRKDLVVQWEGRGEDSGTVVSTILISDGNEDESVIKIEKNCFF